MSQSEPDKFKLGADGWCLEAKCARSPNFDARPAATSIRLLVLHNISLPPGQFGGSFISDLFCNRLDFEQHPYFDQLRALRVSAHFLIRRDGELTQFVSCCDRAWHAGVSSFEGKPQCNDYSIGIELEGADDVPFGAIQYEALVALTHALQSRFPLTDVAGHEHIAAGRKTDPGPFFDWVRYQRMLTGSAPSDGPEAALRFPARTNRSEIN